MSDYKVAVSKEAQAQIRDIRDYIRDELCSPPAAVRFVDQTEAAMSSLGTFPYAHMVRSHREGEPEIRQFFYRTNYCLFYVIDEVTQTVRVIRVSYSRRDLDTLLRQDL